ncbi:MAG: hypothetical protein SGJ27_14770 [Candidatus Melainabacteria bacterium]|nr:hypothetical protein [Candidatus Melainabacteria bacterium]
MKERNVSLERVRVPPDEIVANNQAPRLISSASDRENDLKVSHDDFENSQDNLEISKPKSSSKKSKKNDPEWKKTALHQDFNKINASANLITYALFFPVAAVGFGITTMFGFPLPLAGITAIGLAVGWVIYRSEQKAWYHYASWVFETGQSLECDLDLVSSGELDQPYIVLKDVNRLSHVYDTKVFKVVVGDTQQLYVDHNAPGAKLSFRAIAYFEKKPQENVVIFELAEMRLWCKPHLSRGF